MKYLQCLIFIFIASVSLAQKSLPDTISAISLKEKITLDGKAQEPIWQKADKIFNFTQTEPDFGKPAAERTQVAITYSGSALYIAVWCYQNSASGISAKSLSRDFDFEAEDNFRFATVRDRSTQVLDGGNRLG